MSIASNVIIWIAPWRFNWTFIVMVFANSMFLIMVFAIRALLITFSRDAIIEIAGVGKFR